MKINTDSIDSWGKNLEDRIQRWIQTETAFNFLRYTTGRVILAIFTIAVLYFYGWVAFKEGGRHIVLYPLAIGFVALLQKVSVRYAFDNDSTIDEFQHKRRNRAYRRAYKRVGLILLTIGALVTWQFLLLGTQQALGLADHLAFLSPMEFHMTFEKSLVLGSFLIGLFMLQKYLSWGLRGEPKN